MKKHAFNTGEPHQAGVATWARKRLVDRGGADFDDGTGSETPAQIGCLFADGVGLGKTWEALATIALLLGKHEQRGRRKRSRQSGSDANLRRQRAHVLILVPPGLVAKWSRELRNPDGFQTRLARWARKDSRGFVAATLAPRHCFTIRRRDDLSDLPRGKRKHGKYVLPAGTYVCNWNVFLSPGGPLIASAMPGIGCCSPQHRFSST
jgi:SNF2-related domain